MCYRYVERKHGIKHFFVYIGAIHKGWLAPGEGGLRNPDVQLLFECNSIVLSGRKGGGRV